MKEEVIVYGRLVWQSETAKKYCCPFCDRWLSSQHEGEDLPRVVCHGPMADHRLIWDADALKPGGGR